ncbi:MAG: phosphodiesterase [Alphaproteobacteria bacterium]
MGLRILAHRGLWREKAEQNRPAALLGALEMGFGLETDLRDLQGRVAISHDMADATSATLAELAQQLAAMSGPDRPLALNIKADGLALALADWARPLADRLFFFDMSVPDLRQYLRLGLPCFTRHSDVETVPSYYDPAVGVWLDEMEREWLTAEVVAEHLAAGKRVAIVSGELHRRDHHRSFELARRFRDEPGVMVCTDHPQALREFLA